MEVGFAHHVDLPVTIRPWLPGDVGLVVDSWLRSFRIGSSSAKAMLSNLYQRSQKEIIDSILQRAEVLVACSPGNPDLIFAFIVFEKEPTVTALHYLYTKAAFRRFGLARKLVDSIKETGRTLEASHKTDLGGVLLKKHGIIWNPLLAR